MTSRFRRWNTGVGLLPCLGVLWSFFVCAAPLEAQTPHRPFKESTHALRAILNDSHWQLKPLLGREFFSQCDNNPSQVVVIVLGKSDILDDLFPRGLEAFLRGGGAVLVATDRWEPGGWHRILGVQVVGTSVSAKPATPDRAYRQLAYCPFVESFPRPDWSPFLGLTRIATNRPSFLDDQRHRFSQLARLPEAFESKEEGDPGLLFAVGGQLGKGRALVLADHSIFINDMMLREDNDNIAFTYNCIRWLTEDGRRNQVLLIDEGEVVTTFEVPLREVPDPPLPSLSELGNRFLNELEEKDALHNFLYENVRGYQVLRALAIVLAVVLAGYGLVRLLRARQRTEPQGPLFAASLEGQASTLPVLEQRQDSMVRDGNWWEAARELARQSLTTLHAVPTADGREPPISVRGGWRQRRTLRKQVHRLWQLAHDGQPERISAQEFSRLAAQAAQVERAYQQGTWRLESEGEGSRHDSPDR